MFVVAAGDGQEDQEFVRPQGESVYERGMARSTLSLC